MEQTKGSTAKELFKKDSVKSIILLGISIASVFIFWFGLKAALGTEYPLLAVSTPSMEPTLLVGDLIMVQGINFSQVNAASAPNGDIIVFRGEVIGKPGDLIVHRAVRWENIGGTAYIRTKGDANSGEDGGRVTPADLIGKVVGRVPWLGYVSLFFQPMETKLIIIALIIVYIFVAFFWEDITKLIRSLYKKPEPQPLDFVERCLDAKG